jgi:hypothetical protein
VGKDEASAGGKVCCQHLIQTQNDVEKSKFFSILRTLSKSAKSESSSQRLRMMCWNSASLEGLQSPFPSMIVALKAAIKGVKVSRPTRTLHSTYPCSRSLSDRGSHCCRYLRKGEKESSVWWEKSRRAARFKCHLSGGRTSKISPNDENMLRWIIQSNEIPAFIVLTIALVMNEVTCNCAEPVQ